MSVAFVTGGTGFVGRNLIERLIIEGWDVVASYRSEAKVAPLKHLPVHWVRGSITELASLEQAMPERAEAVFHVAGNTNFWFRRNPEQTRDNVEGTRNMVVVAIKRNVRRFVHTSSIAAYGFHLERITEETRSNALDSGINYFRTKRLAELEVLRGVEQGLDAVIVNPSNIMGPYDRHNWAKLFLFIDSGKLHGVPPGEGSFCHVREVARAHVEAYRLGHTGENYLLGGTDAKYLEVIRRIGELLDRKVPTKPMPAWVLRVSAYPFLWGSYLTGKEPDLTPEKAAFVTRRWVCSSRKAERELGYHPVELKTMLQDGYAWLNSEGLLTQR